MTKYGNGHHSIIDFSQPSNISPPYVPLPQGDIDLNSVPKYGKKRHSIVHNTRSNLLASTKSPSLKYFSPPISIHCNFLKFKLTSKVHEICVVLCNGTTVYTVSNDCKCNCIVQVVLFMQYLRKWVLGCAPGSRFCNYC